VHVLYKDARAEDKWLSADLTDELFVQVNDEDIIIHGRWHTQECGNGGGFEIPFISLEQGYGGFIDYTASTDHHWNVWIELGAEMVDPEGPNACVFLPQTHLDMVVNPD